MPNDANSYGSTIDLLNEVAEFLGDYADVRDGSDGEQVPNHAMHLQSVVEREIERLKRSSGPSHEDRVFCLEDALRPFAMQADTMYHLKDGDKVCGMYVAWFRTAAQMMNEAADRSSATHSEGETK
jgi:hypothetical protein